jgi:hypothetical protein
VVVDLTDTGLRLERTNNVLFVGVRFRNGRTRLTEVRDVRFWYCEFTFPAAEWHRQYTAAGGPLTAHRDQRAELIAGMANPMPTGLWVTTSDGVGVYGSDLHDVGDDGIMLVNTDGVRVEGTRIWNISEDSYDPGRSFGNSGDWFHNDGIQDVSGGAGIAIEDSWVGQKIQWTADRRELNDTHFRRLWLAGSSTFGMIAAVRGGGRILASSMTDIRAFANGRAVYPSHDRARTDFVDGTQRAVWPRQHFEAGRFELPATNIDTTTPAGIATTNGRLNDINQVRDHPDNPANRWRTAHPYTTWNTHLTNNP